MKTRLKEADEVLENVCRALTANLLNGKGSVSTWYCALLCSKDFATLCVQQIRKLIAAISSGWFSSDKPLIGRLNWSFDWSISSTMRKPKKAIRRCTFVRHNSRLSVYFTLLVVLTDASSWPLTKLPTFAKLKGSG